MHKKKNVTNPDIILNIPFAMLHIFTSFFAQFSPASRTAHFDGGWAAPRPLALPQG